MKKRFLSTFSRFICSRFSTPFPLIYDRRKFSLLSMKKRWGGRHFSRSPYGRRKRTRMTNGGGGRGGRGGASPLSEPKRPLFCPSHAAEARRLLAAVSVRGITLRQKSSCCSQVLGKQKTTAREKQLLRLRKFPPCL